MVQRLLRAKFARGRVKKTKNSHEDIKVVFSPLKRGHVLPVFKAVQPLPTRPVTMNEIS